MLATPPIPTDSILFHGSFAHLVQPFYRREADASGGSVTPVTTVSWDLAHEHRIVSLSVLNGKSRHIESLIFWSTNTASPSLQIAYSPQMSERNSLTEWRTKLHTLHYPASKIAHLVATIANTVFYALQVVHDHGVCLNGCKSAFDMVHGEPLLRLDGGTIHASSEEYPRTRCIQNDIQGLFHAIIGLCIGKDLPEPPVDPQVVADTCLSAFPFDNDDDYIVCFSTIQWALWALFVPRSPLSSAQECADQMVMCIPWMNSSCLCAGAPIGLQEFPPTSHTPDILLAQAALSLGKKNSPACVKAISDLVCVLSGDLTVVQGLYGRNFIPRSELKRIGNGAYAQVVIGKYSNISLPDNRIYQLVEKLHLIEASDIRGDELVKPINELVANILLRKTQGISTIHGFWIDTSKKKLVIHQYFPYGGKDLYEIVKTGALKDPLAVFRQIAAAVVAAHEKGIRHCDLISANVLLRKENDSDESDGLVSLIDFGLSMVTQGRDEIYRQVIATAWRPPESLSQNPKRQAPSPKTDPWGIGVCMWMSLTGNMGFFPHRVSPKLFSYLPESERNAALEEAQWWAYQVADDGFPFPALTRILSESQQERLRPFTHVLERCLHPDPEERCTVAECLAMLNAM